ncbi:cation diffusion facilitator family transporter [Geofilum sp. OHC36d9]|uniref:cation diffusion facilitator family transporter n=1 Tax=Geofilum sp. OHC36d9 TaxID=3458413 RepID=UPI0040341E4B
MRSKTPFLATWLSIVLNILLAALKFWAGIVSNSVAIMADAWHTLSDSVSSIAVLVGLKFSAQPADRQHPFGHGRAELIASLVVGVLLAVVGFSFLVESFIKFQSKESVQYGALAIWVTVISVVVKEIMARYSIIIGKKFKYNSLKADGWHHRSDAISSLVILVGIIFGESFWWMDSVLGFLVSFMIFYTTYSIMKDSISVLLGEALEPEIENEIIDLGRSIVDKLDLKPHKFQVHRYGNHTELTFHIILPGEYSLYYAHEIATKYEIILAEKLDVAVTIHVDADE